MRPPYLSSVLLQKILRAGKSINFLRHAPAPQTLDLCWHLNSRHMTSRRETS